jgi:hypothetical protein
VGERDEALRRWRLGEERLYPVVTLRPDLYEASIGLVRALADHLANVPDLDALVTTYRATAGPEELEQAGIDASALPPEMDLDLVRDAAYQLRARELQSVESADRAQRLIGRARSAGQATVTIWAEGEQELWPPYRRVEMSLATGFAVSASTELDADRMVPRFAVEGLQLDPDTGQALEAAPITEREVYADPDEWRAAIARLRQSLLTP